MAAAATTTNGRGRKKGNETYEIDSNSGNAKKAQKPNQSENREKEGRKETTNNESSSTTVLTDIDVAHG